MGKPYRGTPPPLPWEKTSHYPGYQVHDSPAAIAADAGEPSWIPVGSSNVRAIRFVRGDDYPLQVMFHGKAGQPESTYGYAADESTFDNMFGASSMGRFVHHVLKAFPYRRLA